MEPDFSGYVTKAGLKCSDGRTIMPNAFEHQNTQQVPLVWAHMHDDPENVLGHVLLENREDGVYGRAYFNDNPKSQAAKQLVQHKDINMMSIWANQLVEKAKQVFHGSIKEVSLVLAGANPGALIDYIQIEHGDGSRETVNDEAIITTGLEIEVLEHAATATKTDDSKADADKADENDKTVQEVYDSMTDEQKMVVDYMVGAAAEEAAAESNDNTAQHSDKKDEGDLTHQEGKEDMTRNLFEQNGGAPQVTERPHLTPEQFETIKHDAMKSGSFKEALLAHADEYGIENINLLFPDAKAVDASPELVSRQMQWVTSFLSGTNHLPFSKIKSRSADITQDEARAKGYIKTTMKKEEYFALTQRITSATTVYKKQKLDRDDIVDITDIDVVAWLWAEMRLMLNEEIARAGLVGDGRDIDDEDKVQDGSNNGVGIRPIAFDDPFYAHQINLSANPTAQNISDAVANNAQYYRGTGRPNLYTTASVIAQFLTVRDTLGRRIYQTVADIAAELNVDQVIAVPVMEDVVGDNGNLVGVIVNPGDYSYGTTAGGEINQFDFFDIDFNQFKYLIETRTSGALTKYKTAMVIWAADGNTVVTPTAPTFNAATGVVTIPSQTGVTYTQDGVAVTAGAQTAIAAGDTTEVVAAPTSGYQFTHDAQDEWSFTRDA